MIPLVLLIWLLRRKKPSGSFSEMVAAARNLAAENPKKTALVVRHWLQQDEENA